MSKQVLLLALSLLFFHCSSTPGKRIPEEKFVVIYADLIVVGQKSYTQGWDRSRSQQEADSVLAHAGVTREDYQATVEWLTADVERWKGVSEQVVKIIDSTRQTAGF